MQAQYVSEASSRVKTVSSQRSSLKAMLFSLVSLALVGFVLLSGPLKSATVHADEDKGTDPVRFVMCLWGDDSIPAEIYQATQSSDIQFQTRSKSTMNFGTDRVDTGLNAIMQLFGPDYVDVNKEILGRTTNAEYENKDDDEKTEDDSKDKKEFNKGDLVNPFDRFGVAGLKFTGYTGEWKHVIVDACKPETDPIDPKSNAYYDDRLEPQSTWEDISKSQDVRTKQFSKGLPSQYGQAIGNVLANWVFLIPKAMVVMTVALINFSFADVGDKLGVVDLLVGKDGEGGVFTTVFDNLYVPLLSVVMLIFGIWIIGVGMVQSRVREAISGVLRSFLMILVAFMIAANPGPVVNAPNSIAVFFQGIILNTMSQTIESQGELCNTDIGSVEKKIAGESDDAQESLEESASNIRSVVGCTFWQMFLVTPWAEAQYGADWNELWVKDKIPDWASKDATYLKNTNGKMVGDAAVPIGDGKFLNNWAIFQISAQTDAHSPIGDDGAVPKYSSGVSTDWWRIVDAVSNYKEKKVTVDGGAVTNDGGGGSNSGDGQTNGAWGGHENGKIPDDELKEVSFDKSHKLRTDASEALTKMNEAYKKEFNKDISITDSYRSYEEQVKIKEEKPDLAATPGTSNHGWGLALDLGGGINNWGTKERDWMVQNASKYGWVSPSWAQKGNGKEEPWHWEYVKDEADSGASDDDDAASQHEADEEGAYYAPDETAKPTNEWDTWTGNSAWVRIAGASSAALVAGIGLLAPFVLSLLASSAALGSVILMAFAPLMLLLGAGPGRLFEVFKAWLKLVVNVTITRIALGILLVLSIIFTMTAIGMIAEAGWWKGMIVLVLSTIMILRARPKFVAMLTDLSFAAHDLSGGMKRISGGMQNIGKAGVRTAAVAGAGAVNSKRYGGSFARGAFVGARNELKNQAYRNSGARSALATYETMKHNSQANAENFSQVFCANCGRDIGDPMTGRSEIAGRDDRGNYYCQECFEDGFAPAGTSEIVLDNTAAVDKRNKRRADKTGKPRARKSTFQNDAPKGYRQQIVGNPDLSDENREALLHKLAKGVGYEVLNYEAALQENNGVATPPEIPSEIRPYLDVSTLNKAWETQNYDYIQAAYSIAWASWFEETTGQELSSSITSFTAEVGASAEYIRSQDLRPEDERDSFEDEVDEAEDEGKEEKSREEDRR